MAGHELFYCCFKIFWGDFLLYLQIEGLIEMTAAHIEPLEIQRLDGCQVKLFIEVFHEVI